MRLFTKPVWLVLAIAGLLLGLACGPLTRQSPTPLPPVPVSTQAAGRLEDKLQQAAATAQVSGDIRITLTEEELTSYIALQLSQSLAEQGLIISNPQVRLRDGKLTLSGTYRVDPVTVNPVITLSVTAVNGRPVANVESANFGILPVPGALLSQVSQSINQTLAQQLPANATITSVTIADGQMTILGTIH